MAYRRKLEQDIRCPLEYGMSVFGGKWKSRILCVLTDGPMRYSKLRSEMVDVTDAALASALKDLENSGLIARKQYEEIPPRVEYRLTEKGLTVIPILQNICNWSGLYYNEVDEKASGKCQRCDFRG